MTLSDILHQTFGFPAFRPNQEAVCRAATEGRDVLLVMPTGAGKSLCYQLPAVARGGTALVISPLIALMDDQAAKLTGLGLRVARIHSGLPPDSARQACRAYLDGGLQFLFIAPERMRVPGFPEMLARRKPALIAIDEAHCISAWGHDFRPDYRTLGEHLPLLRPSPIIALTATATPTVQRDIVAQLQLADPALFIHGFRRSNLHIEVVEMAKPRRNEFVVALLAKPENRPAIVYAPSRKASEELAGLLGGKAAVYHAGLDPGTRERVQSGFQSGKVEVVVATIAFGMGIDKADVRTVVHIALPASVEAYYQEIGRAGRDGLPSRTVLLHSFADRKMHDFFLERDYPPAPDLAKVAAVLTPEYQMPTLLAQRLKMDLPTFDKAAEKLAVQGAAAFDIEGNVRGSTGTAWKSGYEAQIAFRREQIDRMVAFAEAGQCRMAALVRYFGDTNDSLKPCGHCDFCAPEHATASLFREPTAQEDRHLRAILAALQGGVSRSTGKLHTDLALTPDRKLFDTWLDALARASLLTLTSETFTAKDDGRIIAYKKATLTHEGGQITATAPLHALVRDEVPRERTATRERKPRSRLRGLAASGTAASAKASGEVDKSSYSPSQVDLEARLLVWREGEAQKARKPGFFVLSAAVCHAIVCDCPTSIPLLSQISGIGPDKIERYGADIVALCRNTSPEIGSLNLATAFPPQRRVLSATAPTVTLKPLQQIARRAEGAPGTNPSPPSKPPSPRTSSGESSVDKSLLSHAPGTGLTPEQQRLDTRLRAWRAAESERRNQPQFFVLSTSALRSIALSAPQNLAQLKTIPGLGPEKLDTFGAAILAVCTQE